MEEVDQNIYNYASVIFSCRSLFIKKILNSHITRLVISARNEKHTPYKKEDIFSHLHTLFPYLEFEIPPECPSSLPVVHTGGVIVC